MKFWLAGLLIAIVVVIDFFASFYFLARKKPEEVMGLTRPKATLTPFPTLIVQSEINKSNFSSPSPTLVLFNNLPQIKQADVVFNYDKFLKMIIDYGGEIPLASSSLLMVGIVCDDKFCESDQFDLANGWPKEWKFFNKQNITNNNHNRITLVIKDKNSSQGVLVFSKN